MAKAKWIGQLSTTEHNHIGLVKVRQDNVNSEAFEFQIVENNIPYDLTGLEVFFNTHFSRFSPVQQRAIVIDAKKGIIQYTMNDNDMQKAVTLQPAYFEFRNNDVFVGSTQTFHYHIIGSIYQDCTNGETYIVKLEELFKLYQDFFNSQSQDWYDFLEINREILENIDPGGKIITELTDARLAVDGTRYASVKERLDSEFGDLSKFRPWDKSVISKMENEFKERTENVFWGGVKGDGTDETDIVKGILGSEVKSIFFPETQNGYIINELIINTTKKLIGNQSEIRVTEQDKRAFYFYDLVKFIENIVVKGFVFSQPDSSDPGSGMANNHASTSLLGSINGQIVDNYFKDVSLGLTFQFGEIGLGNRQGKFNLAAFNLFRGVEKMAIENIGTAYNRIVANAIDGQGANSHGIRITGYGEDHINTKGEGIVGTSNIINGMANAYSLQNTAKFNSFSASSSSDLSFAVIDVKRPTIDDNSVEFNAFKGITFNKVKNVVAMNGGQFNDFDVIGKDVSGIAIEEYSPGQGLNPKGHNRYRATIKDIQNNGVVIRQNSAVLDLDLINIQGTGLTISSDASYVTGQAKVESADIGINLLGNNCLLDLHVIKCDETSGGSIVISGKNNVITVNTDKNIVIGGENNTVTGFVGGVITQVSGRGTHNISGVTGYSTRQQAINKATDSIGCVTIQHKLKTELAIVNVNMFGSSSNSVVVKNIANGNVVFEFRKDDGSLVTNGQVSFLWSMDAI